jgi:hypothetical protein
MFFQEKTSMNCTRRPTICRQGRTFNRARFGLAPIAAFKLTPADIETLVASFPGTWVNCATKGGSVSSSTNFTVN